MTDRSLIVCALVTYGFSHPKAVEIAIDAERRDPHAVAFVNKALDHKWSRDMDAMQAGQP